MKKNKIILLVLSLILFVLVGVSVYVNFIAKDIKGMSYVVLGSLVFGVLGSIAVIMLGNKYLDNKKDYHVLTVGFLVLLFTLCINILNVVHGYGSLIDYNNYNEYMLYVSSITSVYMYAFFVGVVGLIDFNLYIKYIVEKKGN